jgi:hypothetical protein
MCLDPTVQQESLEASGELQDKYRNLRMAADLANAEVLL